MISASNQIGSGATNTTLAVTASFTLDANDLCILWVASNASGGGPVPTVDNDNGRTWAQVGPVGSLGNYRWYCYRTQQPLATTGAVTIHFATQVAVVYWWADKFAGAWNSGDNGASAVVQWKTGSDTTGTLTSYTIPALAALRAGSASYASFLPASFGALPTPEPGWTGLRLGSNFTSEWTLNGDTTASLSWPSASIVAGMSLEIAAAPTIAPAGIGTLEAVGSMALAVGISMTGIASAEALSAPALGASLATTGIASSEAFTSPALNLLLGPSGIASGEVFGLAALSTRLSGFSGVATAEALGAPVLSASLAALGIASSETFGLAALSTRLSGFAGVPSAEACGVPVFSVSFGLPGIASSEALGVPSLGFGLQPLGIGSAEALGAPVLGAVVAPLGIGPSSAIGEPSLSSDIAPLGIASISTVAGDLPTITLTIDLDGAGIDSMSVVGQPTLARALGLPGIPSDEAVGWLYVGTGVMQFIDLSGAGIATAEALGEPTIMQWQNFAAVDATIAQADGWLAALETASGTYDGILTRRND